MNKNIVFLTGFSGTGKTSVGRLAAELLGWMFVDMDEEISLESGHDISQIFANLGECAFRDLEHKKLLETVTGNNLIISTGGGILTNDKNQKVMSESGITICLEASVDTIVSRLKQDSSSEIRPMLNDDLSAESVLKLKSDRQSLYSQANWTIHTDQLSPKAAANEIVRAIHLINESDETEIFGIAPKELSSVVDTKNGKYPIWVSQGNLGELGSRLKKIVNPSIGYVITDQGANRYAREIQRSMESIGIKSHCFTMEPGEEHKNLSTVELIYKWLAERKAERSNVIVAVGGGVVGDLAGYVAATYLRGMPVVHVPTTLLAMMDSSIGGKTGVDLMQGKNLVGSFHQPKFVLVDTNTLGTLPKRILNEGWAEGLKHGLALDKSLLESFEKNASDLKKLDLDATTKLIKHSISIKAQKVTEDEFEKLGKRILLNYGHTIGHAIESITNYSSYLHGEAVSIGMMAAGHISVEKNLLSNDDLIRQEDLLKTFNLPVRFKNLNIDNIKARILSDKKRAQGKVHWVLLKDIGSATTSSDVTDSEITQALKNVSSI